MKDALNDLVNPDTPANIFIKQIQNGLQPIVTLNDINEIFNTVAIVKRSGYGSIRSNQYMGNDAKVGTTIPQNKLGVIENSYVPKLIDNTVENWGDLLQQKKDEEERKKREKIIKNTIPTVIPDDAIFNSTRPYVNPTDKKELESFEYNGRWYAIESDEEIFNSFLQNDKNVAKYTTCSYIAYLITSDGYIRKKPVIPIAEEWEIKQIEEAELKRKKIKEVKYMNILVKKNNQLVNLGEGRIYSKSQLRLNEDGENALIGDATPNDEKVSGTGSLQTTVNKEFTEHPQEDGVSIGLDALNNSGQKLKGDGTNIKMSQQQLAQNKAQISNLAAQMPGAQLTIMRGNGVINNSVAPRKVLDELRKNSIPFTKKELYNFLRELQ